MSPPARRLLPLPPNPPPVKYKDFIPPPWDGSLCLPELWDWQLTHNPSHRLFIYAKDDDSVETIVWSEALAAIYRGVGILRDRLGWKPGATDTPIVGILAQSDTIPYCLMAMSIIRAGYCVFPISSRNSPGAVAHLIAKTQPKHILVGRDHAMTELAARSLEILQEQHPSVRIPELSPAFLLDDLFVRGAHAKPEDVPPYEFQGPDTHAIILHSSGSTAYPKPITWTMHRFAQICLIPRFGERDLANHVMGVHVMPVFHGMGIVQICWAPSLGIVVGAFESKIPPPIPTPDAVFRAAQLTQSDIIFSVPSLIEAWSTKPEYVDWLATRTGILYGGGPLNKLVGDHLTKRGVRTFVLYGSTETGPMTSVLPAEVDEDWDYFGFPSFITAKMVPYGEDTYECIAVENVYCSPGPFNTTADGKNAYATSDLFLPHPSKPGRWKVFGRTDDQIMHNTGEKTNPGPLESILNQDAHVHAAVMFGRGRFQAGVLIDPKPQFTFDPADQEKLAEFRNKIWPTIERVNAYAPQHSRIFKEMIIVSTPSKPFTYTGKGTPRRQAVINDYEAEIDELYRTVEESTQSSIPAPSTWDESTAAEFVRAVVSKVVGRELQDDLDLFENGCDSLQATWIRNSLLRGLQDTAQLDTRKVDTGFVYSHPSIKSLSAYVLTLASGRGGQGDSAEKHVEAMQDLVAKYTRRLPAHQGTAAAPADGDIVFVTGTTGSLGCHILSRLASDPAVARVYAFNRPAKDAKALSERQRAALAERGLDASLVGSEKVLLLEGDLTKERFGLSEETFTELAKSITHIIHNAWRVDFNLALESFESNVKGVRALIDFALSSPLAQPPKILFESSIGVFQGVRSPEIQQEKLLAPEIAVGNGYTESKWVSETILTEAGKQTSLSPLIVRVGQICGGADGAWNVQEWFPSLVQSAQKLGMFPDDSRAVDWIPVDLTAQALVESRSASVDVTHLIHPRPVAWSSLAQIISAELSVPLVPYETWLAKLEEQAKAVAEGKTNEAELLRDLRALRLLSFWRGLSTLSSESGGALGLPKLGCEKAVAASPSLQDPNLPQLGATDVKRWLAYWRKVGLLV